MESSSRWTARRCGGCGRTGRSLRELGERSGVAFDAINKLELGKRSAQPRTVRKLAEALGVEPRELMKGD
jgi:HTH-type transcriptional regulator, competence development regulator